MNDQLLKACDLYLKQSRGPGERQYLVGYLGGVKILIFKIHNPEPNGPTHALFFAPRPPKKERRDPGSSPGQALPYRGQQTHEAVREKADAVAPGILGGALEPLATSPIPPGGDEVPW